MIKKIIVFFALLILAVPAFSLWSLKHIIFTDPIVHEITNGENNFTIPLVYGGPYVLEIREKSASPDNHTTQFKVTGLIDTGKEIIKFDEFYNPSKSNNFNNLLFSFMYKKLYGEVTININIQIINDGYPIYLYFYPGI